jgi:SAM-dependent methyltransferase
MPACLNCGGELAVLVERIEDWEYGVPWGSRLVMCRQCGLVTQDPPVRAEEIERLYPPGYTAHTPASRSRSIYGAVKGLLGSAAARAVARYIPAGGSCLEVGCGNGAFLARLAEARPDVELAGVDIVDLGVALPRFTFYLGQLEAIDFGARRFDLVYCSNLIEHVPDPFVFLRKCAALLRPGGVLYGVTPDHLSLDRYLFGRYWAGYHYPRHTFVFNHRNLHQVFSRSGFDHASVRGSHGFWYLSLANRFVERPGAKKRGLLFAAVSALFFPLDLLINLFRCHGSLTFVAQRK